MLVYYLHNTTRCNDKTAMQYINLLPTASA